MRSVGLVVMLLVGSAAMHGQEQGGASQTAPAAGGAKEVKILGSAGTRIKAGSAVTGAKLISRVDPVYPPLARQTRISGTVRLRGIIGKDGSVLELSVLSGHPLLIQSALEAVRKWKYTPTLVGGEPVDVETTIDVIFSLNENSNRTGVKQAPQIDPQVRADFSKLLELTKTSERAGEATKKALEPLAPYCSKPFTMSGSVKG